MKLPRRKFLHLAAGAAAMTSCHCSIGTWLVITVEPR
jgi:hypothetical protein